MPIYVYTAKHLPSHDNHKVITPRLYSISTSILKKNSRMIENCPQKSHTSVASYNNQLYKLSLGDTL